MLAADTATAAALSISLRLRLPGASLSDPAASAAIIIL